jgi:putative oxidoreductase
MKFLRLSFIPKSTDFALLLLRLGLGLSMLLLHGWDKLVNFSSKSGGFPDPLGIGSSLSLGLAVFAEVFCAALLIVGFLTRFAALNLVVTMGVAFFMVHKGALSGAGSGEMALLYMIGFLALLFAGSGKFAFERE